MPLSGKLDRSIRATQDESTDDEYYEVTDHSSPSIIDTGEGGEIASSDPEIQSVADEEGNNAEKYQRQLSNVSFGALSKAQEALSKQEPASRKRKRGSDTTAQQEDKLQALRNRLREIKDRRLGKDTKTQKERKFESGPESSGTSEDEDGDSDDDSNDDAPRARSSKHAPAVQSSKRAVTRRRAVVEVKKPKVRDPRFDSVGGPRPDENSLKNRYAFLKDYKASEMAELRSSIKKTKNEAERDVLKRKLLSMESQQKASDAKDRKQQLLREHKKKEKELVKQGKKPFYLKKSEQNKIALVDRFDKMNKKERDKAIERRRKKSAARERKNMPAQRRVQ